jgi:hypothetical protein
MQEFYINSCAPANATHANTSFLLNVGPEAADSSARMHVYRDLHDNDNAPFIRDLHGISGLSDAEISKFVAVGRGCIEAAGLGLVQEKTSRTPPAINSIAEWVADNVIEVIPAEKRVKNLRKSIAVASRWIEANQKSKRGNVVLCTLTYRETHDWRADHISAFTHRVRQWYKRIHPHDQLKYVWVAELQARGAVHYHVIFWLPKGTFLPKADKRGWWPHGSTNNKTATKPVGYLMKYASKTTEDNVKGYPRGCRMYGAGGLGDTGRKCKRWTMWPSYIRQNASVNDPWRRKGGGGFINRETGEILEAEYVPFGAGHCTFIRVRTHPRKIDAAGPFSWLTDRPQRDVFAS